MFRHDPQHTGRSPYIGPEVPNLLWTFSAGGWIQSSVAIGEDGTLYVGSTDKNLYAINPDGTLRWSFKTDSFIDSSPAFGAKTKTVYAGSWDGKIYALNSETGNLKWFYVTGGPIPSTSITLDDEETLYTGSIDKKVYAIRSDKTLKWDYLTGGEVHSTPALSHDMSIVYVGSDDGYFYALNSANGNIKWEKKIGARLRSSPAIGSDGTIYVGADNRKLYAINPDDGSFRWICDGFGDVVRSSPAISADGKTVYIGSDGDYLHAINSNDGTVQWFYKTDGNIFSSPVIDANGTIYFGAFDNKLYALNSDGTLKWSFLVYKGIFASPTLGIDGTIYIGSQDRKLYAIGNGFTLKRKLADGMYEAFQVDKHGWSFGNADRRMFDCGEPPGFHEDWIMWPWCWWSQFDYTHLLYQGIYWNLLYPHPTYWDPPLSQDFPDWPLFVYTFGIEQCYYDYPFNYKGKAVAMWYKTYTPIRDNGGWSGSCYGFAISCFMAFKDPVKFYTHDKFKGIGQFNNLCELDINDEIRKVINGLFLYQFGEEQQSHKDNEINKNPKQVVDEIINMFNMSSRELKALNLINLRNSSAHAVNPYKVIQKKPDIWEIYVYDSNYPRRTDRKILVYKDLFTWK